MTDFFNAFRLIFVRYIDKNKDTKTISECFLDFKRYLDIKYSPWKFIGDGLNGLVISYRDSSGTNYAVKFSTDGNEYKIANEFKGKDMGNIVLNIHFSEENKEYEVYEIISDMMNEQDLYIFSLKTDISESMYQGIILKIFNTIKTIYDKGFYFTDLKPANLFLQKDTKKPSEIQYMTDSDDFVDIFTVKIGDIGGFIKKLDYKEKQFLISTYRPTKFSKSYITSDYVLNVMIWEFLITSILLCPLIQLPTKKIIHDLSLWDKQLDYTDIKKINDLKEDVKLRNTHPLIELFVDETQKYVSFSTYTDKLYFRYTDIEFMDRLREIVKVATGTKIVFDNKTIFEYKPKKRKTKKRKTKKRKTKKRSIKK